MHSLALRLHPDLVETLTQMAAGMELEPFIRQVIESTLTDDPNEQVNREEEAREHLEMLAQRQCSLVEIRRMIRHDRELLLTFDHLLLYVKLPALRRSRLVIMPHRNGLRPSAALEAAILARLKRGESCLQIAEELKFRYELVHYVARKHRTACQYRTGRGRRYSPEQIDQIVAALRAGRTMASIRREFGASHEYLQKLRRLYLNDYRDHRRLANEDDMAKALLSGESPREVASRFRVTRMSVVKLRRRLGIYRDLRFGPKLAISDSEREAILEAWRSGFDDTLGIGKQFHHHHSVIASIIREAGYPRHPAHRFTDTERTHILTSFAAGKTAAQISQELSGGTRFRTSLRKIEYQLKRGEQPWQTKTKAA